MMRKVGSLVMVVVVVTVLLVCSSTASIQKSFNTSFDGIIQVTYSDSLPLKPICYWGIDLTRDNSPTGASSPAVSIVSDLSAESFSTNTLLSSSLVSSLFPIGSPFYLSARIPPYCNSKLSSVDAQFTFGQVNRTLTTMVHLFDNDSFEPTDTAAVWCTVSAGCSAEVYSVSLNGDPIEGEFTLDGTNALFGSATQSFMLQQTSLADCDGFQLDATLTLNCTKPLEDNNVASKPFLSTFGDKDTPRAECRFLFGQLCT